MAVHTQQTQWFIVRPEMVRKLGVGLGVFTSAIGLYYAAAHLGPQDAETMPIDKNRVAVDMRKREDKPTRLQAPIDASPAFKVALALKPEIPATVIPTIKPVASPKHVTFRADARQAAAGGKMPSGVLRFDRCIPKCETQDPLIVGYTASRQYPDEAPLSERNEDDSGFNLSPLRGARYILTRAVDVPGAALRTGREVLDSIARSD